MLGAINGSCSCELRPSLFVLSPWLSRIPKVYGYSYVRSTKACAFRYIHTDISTHHTSHRITIRAINMSASRARASRIVLLRAHPVRCPARALTAYIRSRRLEKPASECHVGTPLSHTQIHTRTHENRCRLRRSARIGVPARLAPTRSQTRHRDSSRGPSDG